jgi:hypothetical protein
MISASNEGVYCWKFVALRTLAWSRTVLYKPHHLEPQDIRTNYCKVDLNHFCMMPTHRIETQNIRHTLIRLKLLNRHTPIIVVQYAALPFSKLVWMEYSR